MLFPRRIFTVVAVAALSAPLGAQKPPVVRPATCLEGLREYTSMKDVPIPHDTVMAAPAGAGSEEVNGMRRIGDLGEFIKSLLRGAAAVGATGWVSFKDEYATANGGMQGMGRTLPVFVPSDSARAHAACAAAKKSPPK